MSFVHNPNNNRTITNTRRNKLQKTSTTTTTITLTLFLLLFKAHTHTYIEKKEIKEYEKASKAQRNNIISASYIIYLNLCCATELTN
jgi:hypothetical protein